MKNLLKIFLLIAGLVFSGLLEAEISIASFNIERLGHGQQKSFKALAEIGSRLDFLMVQEVMTEKGLKNLVGALEKRTGESWRHMNSHAIGRGSHKEMYAFVWRDSAVEYADGAVVYLDRGDVFAREPYSARFRSRRSGQEFVAATVHILFGRSKSDRVPEIHALRLYWDWLSEVYPGTERVLGGDFNLPPTQDAWGELLEVAKPLIRDGATTVSSLDGRFASLYDNLWVARDSRLCVTDAGIFNAPRTVGWNHDKFRRHVSDHVPIYLTLGQAVVDASPAKLPGPSGAERRRTDTPADVLSQNDYSGPVRGNRNSRIYHRPDCPSYNRVSERNRVAFGSEAEAVAAGFRLAGNCP